MTAMRRGVTEHMRRSLDTSAHVTSAIEVDMSRVVAAREKLKEEYQASYGVNPTYLAFVAKAAVETLGEWPWVNGEIRGEKIVTRSFVNLGIAVALEDGKGLIVPVIRNAQDLNLLGVARAIADLAERARTKKLMPDDVQGGTFTITNPGGYGTFHGTPIISQPQAGILGTYAVVKRPWVVQDELGQDVIAIRPLMNITLTYDHRLVDGAYAGGFLRDLRDATRGVGRGLRVTQRIVPMIAYADAAAAIDWLTEAFGFRERTEHRHTDKCGNGHARRTRAGRRDRHARDADRRLRGPRRHRETCEAARRWQDNHWVIDGLLVVVDDVDTHHDRAVAAGAAVIRPLADVEATGMRLYTAEDPEGHRWMFAQQLAAGG